MNDFQSNSTINVLNGKDQLALVRGIEIYDKNLINCCICFAVRKSIKATWLNDRDQFLYPNDNWKTDTEFHNDCLAFTLFTNEIQSKFGINHWIPFTESEVNAQEKFESHFMTNFIKGKLKVENDANLFSNDIKNNEPVQFSKEATGVFNAGSELWKYYHSQKDLNVNASLYDIREYFQGRNEKGRMNSRSTDEKYTELIGNLRKKVNLLSDKIAPKVYEYEFLIR